MYLENSIQNQIEKDFNPSKRREESGGRRGIRTRHQTENKPRNKKQRQSRNAEPKQMKHMQTHVQGGTARRNAMRQGSPVAEAMAGQAKKGTGWMPWH